MENYQSHPIVSLLDIGSGAMVGIDHIMSEEGKSYGVFYGRLHGDDCQHEVCVTADKATALVILASIMAVGAAEFDRRIGYAEQASKAQEN